MSYRGSIYIDLVSILLEIRLLLFILIDRCDLKLK
jgi:hypothetical protein